MMVAFCAGIRPSCATISSVDDIERNILALLQNDGRMSVTELANHVGLSTSACSRRLHELHRDNVITGYHATINPAALGLGFEVLASVTMQQEDADTVERFEAGLHDINEVRHAERLFGDPDFLIRLITTDINHYQHIRDTRLATLPGVQKITSTIVMRRIIDQRPLAIPTD
jgi:DNA-binding Lrp family transcriptional regulator